VDEARARLPATDEAVLHNEERHHASCRLVDGNGTEALMGSGTHRILLITCGLQCSGKSTLAARLRDALGIDLVSSDEVRVRLLGNAKVQTANPLERYVVYYQTLQAARNALRRGRSVIVDGTFSKRVFRRSAYCFAQEEGASVYIAQCVCNHYGLVQERYERRREQKKVGTQLFDEWTDLALFHRGFQEFEPLDRETMPDGRPVPIVRYDSERERADIVYSDGSEIIESIVDAAAPRWRTACRRSGGARPLRSSWRGTRTTSPATTRGPGTLPPHGPVASVGQEGTSASIRHPA
jgi:predicted kinase